MIQTGTAPVPAAAPGSIWTQMRDRSNAQRDLAGALCEAADRQRTRAVRERKTALQPDQISIQLVWRARQLRYDLHGPVPAMAPPDPTENGADRRIRARR
jgi:hypothetical protein